MTHAAVNAALEMLVQSVKASPYGRAYSGYGAAPRLRQPRLPRLRTARVAVGLPRPAADPYGVYGVRQPTPRLPGLARLRGY